MPDKEKEYDAFSIEIGVTASHVVGDATEGEAPTAAPTNGRSNGFFDVRLLSRDLPHMMSNMLLDLHGTKIKKGKSILWASVHEEERHHTFFYLDVYTDHLLACSILRQIAETALEDKRFHNQFWVVDVTPLVARKRGSE